MNIVTESQRQADELEHLQFDGLMFKIIPGMKKALEVSQIDCQNLTHESFLKDWVFTNKPCVIRGAIKHWAAIEKVKTKEYWLSICENFEVSILPHMNYNGKERQTKGSMSMMFYDAIERLFSGQDYVFSLPSERITQTNHFAKLIDDMPGFAFLPSSKKPRDYDRRRFFLYRRASTSWHHHSIDETLMCQVKGMKRVALLPPRIKNAKMVSNFLEKELYLEGKALPTDWALPVFYAEVSEGDALYIPPYWLHAVIPAEGNVGLTLAYCWSSPMHKFGDLTNYFVRKLYYNILFPFKKVSLLIPFIAIYSVILLLLRTMRFRFKRSGSILETV